MDKALKATVSDIRLKFRNPYALIEYFEADEVVASTPFERLATNQEIQAERKRLQNPHAFSNGDGTYSGFIPRKKKTTLHLNATRTSKRETDSRIETLATKILRALWKDTQNSGAGVPTDPITVIDPVKALEFYGFHLSYEENLGTHLTDGGIIEVAGVLENDAKLVQVSNKFPPSVRLFTAAHELGHAALHNISGTIHRDRPLSGESLSREPIEYEADKFATYFLMPGKLVRTSFRETFGMECFVLTEDTAFGLSCSSLHDIKKHCKSLRDLSRLLADATNFHGRHFPSLAEQFRVSVKAMAIRFEELDLIENAF